MSTSSIEQTLPMTSTKLMNVSHRFVSKKIFKPETCFVVNSTVFLAHVCFLNFAHRFQCQKRINFGSISYRCSYCSQSSHVNCKENAGSHCKNFSNNTPLPPKSPKTPTVTTLKQTHRQRMINSEPRPKPSPTTTTSITQRRLPFERMMLHKVHGKN